MARRHVIVPGCVLAITALALTAAPAVATRPTARAPGTPAADLTDLAGKPPPGMLEAIARDIGLTEQEARTRLLNEARLTPIETNLRGWVGDHFGGSWFAGDVAQTLVVATTDSTDVSQIAELGARPLLVGRSLIELRAIRAAVDAALIRERGTTASVRYVGVRVNKVVILTENPKAAQEAVKTAKVDPDAVQVIASTERPRLLRAHRKAPTETDLVGGQAYYVGATTRCSVGFSVTKDTQKGFISAGHCGTPGSATVGYNRRPQGTVQASTFPGQDFSWVKVNDDWNPRPLVGNDSGGTVQVRGFRAAVEGSSVCHSGSGSGWHCGTIAQRGASVTYPRGTVYGLTRTTVCAEPGDSGGSFISLEQAQGITSGGSGDCASGGVTYFQPILEILTAYGLNLTVEELSLPGPGTCTSYPRVFTGTLKSRRSAYWPQDRGFVTTVTGTYSACLSDDPSRDRDLYLEKWNGRAWSAVAASEHLDSYEQITYFGTPGRYRYRVFAEVGSGPYTLGHEEP
ncbi:S1 family peptidase [Streptosporangium sp. NBC_01495]|uniref:S1 family peptidase n=1 Tax=Streptosporangium sp. NBC_01495 TaxID=2903899 RepID=UPI002E30F9B4|nr:S1 family peptidase [Streptosporangium sp. NBC_01495]